MADIVHLYSGVGETYEVTIDAHRSGGTAVDAIQVVVRSRAGQPLGKGEFKAGFDLPGELVHEGRLKRWSTIQNEIRTLREGGRHALAAALAGQRDQLRAALATCRVRLDAGAGAFLGIDGVGFADADAAAFLAIDMAALDPEFQPTPADDAPVLTARLSVNGSASLGAHACTAAMLIDIVVTRRAVITAMPTLSLDAPDAARLPALDLRWPRIDWPGLDWPALDLTRLATLLRFDLPIPNAGNHDRPLRIDWVVPPRIGFVVDAQKRLTIATTQAGTGALVCDSKDAGGKPTAPKIADIAGFRMALSGDGELVLGGAIQPARTTIDLPHKWIDGPDALPFTIEIDPGSLAIDIRAAIDLSAPVVAGVSASLDLPRLKIRAKSDPTLVLVVGATYRQDYEPTTGVSSGALTRLEVIEPYPVALLGMAARAAADAAAGLIRFTGAVPLSGGGLPDSGLGGVVARMAAMAGAAVTWLTRQVGRTTDALVGLAEAVAQVLSDMVRRLCESLSRPVLKDPHLAVEIRLDARSFALRQIVVSPAWRAVQGAAFTGEFAMLDVGIPLGWRPSLVIDLDGPVSIALVAFQSQARAAFMLGTDLWLSRAGEIGAVADTDKQGGRPAQRLIRLSATLRTDRPIVIFRLGSGKPGFFETMEAKVAALVDDGVSIAGISGPISYAPLDWSDIDVGFEVAPGTPERLLPFLQSPGGNAGASFLDNLGQYIAIRPGAGKATNGKAALALDATLKVGGAAIKFPLSFEVDLTSLACRLSGPEQVVIKGSQADGRFDMFGMSGAVVPKAHKAGSALPAGAYDLWKLDFSKGDARLSLADDARLDLSYGRVASGGGGIVFRVDELGLSRSGLDLDARVDPEVPVQLAGVDMPFRFDSGGLSIKGSEIQTFSIKGAGQLPPELVGEANATISISMGRGKDGALIVQSAEATLDKAGGPVICHGTRFRLTLSAVGLQFQDFSAERAGYHFYFTLTGVAEFKPRPGEFGEGLLKNLGNLTITLDKAPLARDEAMLVRAIDFQVAVEPKKSFRLFNMFGFELRGIGFHPASPAFGGGPAMSISGQVNFVEAGDIVSPRFDFHKLWIAPPKPGTTLPQLRFDGLTLGVRFGGAASIEGTAIAVDDQLPSLYSPGALQGNVTAQGFLASGKLTIKGWGQMAASMGFLELRRRPGGEPRQAFFLYGQAGEQSVEIPTPLGPIYLREFGFGFGYRFTLAAFNRADQVRDVKGLVRVLDDISKYQGELASVRAWEPEADGNRLTLALRGLISIASVSEPGKYNAAGEKHLSNPILFDIVAALRSDLTYFMNARVWMSRNYADWHDSSAASDGWRTNPTLRGYVYLSVPRKEFLGRMIADGKGDVDGRHPALPGPLVEGMKAVRWSATTYIRPGLFHQEFGWPYELGFTFKRGDIFQIVCEGGLVNRIEDQSILYGIAFRAKGFAQIGGAGGGRSFGASVVARADFAIDAKFIAHLSLGRFNDALFYGALALDVSISLQVRIWLEFSIGIDDVRVEVGFSLSLTISIAIEVAVSEGAIGGRATASVGVGAFGRSLRLGVGFGFNEGLLATARSRAERFLALGLSVATPDAEQGVAPPAPEQPRGPAARNADIALDQALEKQHDIAEEQTAAPRPQGRKLQPSRYWAMLFPVAGDSARGERERFVMTFVPRDHSEAEFDPEPVSTADPPGSFYAPPPALDADTSVPPSLLIQDGSLDRRVEIEKLELLQDENGRRRRHVAFGGSGPVEISYAVGRTAFRSGQAELPLGRCLAQCFVNVGSGMAGLREPVARRILARSERLPGGREAAAQILTEAGRDQLALGVEERAANDIEERRSAVIAALCESAAALAMGGEAAWDAAPAVSGLDVRALGIAFVVTRSQIDQLFGEAPEGGPRPARFGLQATDARIAGLQPVHLFNSPDRLFRERGPRLAEPIVEATRNGIRLDWDLEPAFGRSEGVWHDPEFDLRHYRIERVLMDASGGVLAGVPPRRVTAKAAAPLRLVRDFETGRFVWRFIRPNAQYVDDLSDLSEALRAAILPGAAKAGGVANRHDQKAVASVRYIIVPVDTAGTDGAPTPLQLDIVEPRRARAGIRRAVLNFEYRAAGRPLRDIDATPLRPAMTLGLDDGVDMPQPKGGGSREGRSYVMRVRRERSVPSGLYGADAVTDALARPSAGDFARRQASDEDFELVLSPSGSNEGTSQVPSFEAPLALAHPDGYRFVPASDHERFLKAVGVEVPAADREREGARGIRFAIRPKPDDTELPAPWCPIDITMLIDTHPPGAPASTPPAVAAPVEVFEHLLAIDAAPLLFDDLAGESGRVLVCHPIETGLLDDLLPPACGQLREKPGLVLLRDGERRVATRLRWNARPATEDGDAGRAGARRLARWFGGFDLFETDVASDVEGATSDPTFLAISCKFSASVEDADPGSGLIRLNRKPQSRATALFLSLRDRSGADLSAALDQLNDSPERVKGQVRLVKAGDPSCWLAFDLTAAVAMPGYRKLMLTCTDASAWSEQELLKNNDGAVLLFTRFPARHIARVQALPAASARLEPPDIADFAKVEARYPSETRRLSFRGAARRAAWFSPAESHVVWPQRTLRRTLSLNVDETILTELMSHGRPTYFEASLTVGDDVYPVRRRDGAGAIAAGPFHSDDGPWNARKLRLLMQQLTWEYDRAVGRDPQRDHEFREAKVVVKAWKTASPDRLLGQAEWSVDLDPPLHPVLADAIDRVRYDWMPPADFLPLKLDLSTFEAQLPASVLGRSLGVDFDLAQWPADLPPCELGFRAGSEARFSSQRFRFPSDMDDVGKSAELRAAVDRLVTRLSARARAALAGDHARNGTRYRAVALRLSCQMSPGEATVSASFPVDVRSMFEDGERSSFRRYEPVFEPQPKVGASDADGWFDETPSERDPYGWSILRTLGLAAGLRLYDTEKRAYLAPIDTLSRLREAIAKALEWYGDCFVGAPFVDVVTRAGGTMRLASFDGAAPGLTSGDVAQLLDRDALALTQISLRPIPDRWVGDANDGAAIETPVSYLSIVFREPRGGTGRPPEIAIDLEKLGPDLIAVADVLDLTANLAKPSPATLSNREALGTDELKALNAALAGAGNALSKLVIDVSRAKDGDIVALVRAIVVKGDAAGAFGEAWVDGGQWREIMPIAEPAAGAPVEPFGRFGDMAMERYRCLAGAHDSIASANEVLYGYLRRRFPGGVAEDALLARIPAWTRRFLLHGPAFRPPRDVHFSLAEVTRPDPWRVGVQEDGSMEALLTHDDRKRRLKRYAVKPFGRYESFVDALNGGDAGASPRVPGLVGRWSDGLAGRDDVQKRFEDSWSRRFLDIVIPRTEPLAPPVLVHARRIEVLPPGESDPKKARRMLEFLYKRHAEELLSESNATVEGALSFETMAVGFWREFPMQRWARDLVPGIDTAEGFGQLKPGPDPAGLVDSDDRFGGLAVHPGGRYSEGWRGVTALRAEALPFFFRVHAVAFASAGVVVSDPVVATVEEGHYELNLPWRQALFDDTTPAPRWSVQRRGGDRPGVYVTFELPLVRLVDCMPVDARPIWLSRGAIPEVFTLPDLLARYEIRALARDASGESSVSTELDIIGEQRSEPSDGSPVPPSSGHRINVVGPLFAAGSAIRDSLEYCRKGQRWWRATVSARLERSEHPSAEVFAPRVAAAQPDGGTDHPLRLIELHPEAFSADAVWQGLAPQTVATVTVRPVADAGPDAFARFKADVTAWRDVYTPYAASPAGREILDFLQAWVESDGIEALPTRLTVSGFVWGLPWLPAGRPAAVGIVPGPTGDWRTPGRAGIDARQAVRQLQASRIAAGYDQNAFAAGVCEPVAMEMRRLAVLRKETEPGNRFRDFPAFAAPLPGDLMKPALMLGLATGADGVHLLPNCADVIMRIAIRADPQADAAGVVALIRAVESVPFTALAVADLGTLEDGGGSALVHLPCNALLDHDVERSLAALSAADPAGWQAVSLLLRMPPTDDERNAIMEGIAAVVPEAADGRRLAAFADQVMSGQVFGPGRFPGLKVFRGNADPAEDVIARAGAGGLPCR